MRFLSHFRSIHRGNIILFFTYFIIFLHFFLIYNYVGAYFAEMKTTTVRKLLPELWGFICPVHTPDGK